MATIESFLRPRHDWNVDEAEGLIARPFHDLLAEAHEVHRARHDPHEVEAAMLLSIKTGACPEDCAYCPQSARWNTGLKPERLMPADQIVAAAENAKRAGATRFCMGAAWREPNNQQVDEVSEAVRKVGALGMETCATLWSRQRRSHGSVRPGSGRRHPVTSGLRNPLPGRCLRDSFVYK